MPAVLPSTALRRDRGPGEGHQILLPDQGSTAFSGAEYGRGTLQGLFPGQGSTAFSGAEHGHGTLQGLDVTKVPNEGQTQTLGRQSDPTWTMKEEMKKNPDNATTDDDHINGNLIEVRERRRNADAEPHDRTANRWTTRLSATTKTSTNTKKAATTYTAILLLRIPRRQSKRRARTVGPTT